MQINGYDYGRARLGTKTRIRRKQNRFVAGGGTVRVRNKSEDEHLITYQLRRLSNAEKTLLQSVFTTTADFASNPIAFVDDWGTSFNGRIWEDSVEFEETAGRMFHCKFTVRVEP